MGYAKLGVRGVSVLSGSGDSGVSGGDCKTNDGTNRIFACFPCELCVPSLPGSPGQLMTQNLGPYITAVGGTAEIAPEQAVDFSGGGFSNYFSRPFYQSHAVGAFLATLGGTYAGLYK